MKRMVEPRCPVRPQDRCSLCQLGATGPADCGLVYLTMDDPELREMYAQQLARQRDDGSTSTQKSG